MRGGNLRPPERARRRFGRFFPGALPPAAARGSLGPAALPRALLAGTDARTGAEAREGNLPGTEEAIGAGGPFTCGGARWGALTRVIGTVIVIETAGLHLLLWSRAPWAAWSLTAVSAALLAWLVADYRALGREPF